MSTYLSIHQKVRTFLRGTETTYPDNLIMDGVNASLKAIMPWLPKRSVAQSLPVTSGSSVTLPDDVYLVDAVYYPEGNRWLKHWAINPSASNKGTPVSDAQWIEYPSGYLSLSSDLTDGVIDVYYYTDWTEVTSSGSLTDSLETPSYADLAIVYYACAYVLGAVSVSAAQLRQFNTRTDSGSPEDNPIRDTSNLLMQRFLNEVKLFPSLERAQK